jgi:hypothetical protein
VALIAGNHLRNGIGLWKLAVMANPLLTGEYCLCIIAYPRKGKLLMRMIIGPRGSGKTAELLRLSASTRIPILTCNRSYINVLTRRAYDMGLDIPQPIYLSDRRGINSDVIIDNAEVILSQLLGCNVYAVSMSCINNIGSEPYINTLDGTINRTPYIAESPDLPPILDIMEDCLGSQIIDTEVENHECSNNACS